MEKRLIPVGGRSAVPDPVERRRSRRTGVRLQVTVVEGREEQDARSLNVSRHGLFLEIARPPSERKLVRLIMHVPNEAPIPAHAFVTRVVPPGARHPPGIGVQLFALSANAKARWDGFVGRVQGLPPEHAAITGPNDGRATFFVRFQNRARLRDFVENSVRQRAVVLTTPVVQEAGAEVTLILVHPESEREAPLPGLVRRVCLEGPRGMDIHFPAVDEQALEAFRRFVESGEVDPVLARLSAPPEPATPNPDLSIDIVVDDQGLGASEQFRWSELGREPPVLQLGLDRPPLPAPSAAHPPEEEITIESVDLPDPTSAEPVESGVDTVARWREALGIPDERVGQIRCVACETDLGSVRWGALPGAMGLFCGWEVRWVPSTERFASVPRAWPLGLREQTERLLGPEAGNLRVPLTEVFKLVAAVARPNSDQRTEGAREAQDLLSALKPHQPGRLERPACPSCRESSLVLFRSR